MLHRSKESLTMWNMASFWGISDAQYQCRFALKHVDNFVWAPNMHLSPCRAFQYGL